jgi:thiol-disulfide isomerase/thioredoxin
MNRKNGFVILFVLLFSFTLQPQTIHLDFPYFGEQDYVVYLLKGEKTDTIYRGATNKEGKSTIVIPPAYSNYTGIARWSLLNGGGLALVLNGEKTFTVRCGEAEPSDHNIEYINTPENEFMYGQYLRQTAAINKTVACYSLLQHYETSGTVYRFIDTEKQRLEKEFAQIQSDIRQSPLYAARIREYSDFLTHTGSRLDLAEEEMQTEQRTFFLERLDLRQLYTSGFWNDVLDAHIASVAGNDSLLLADSRLLLSLAAGTEMVGDVLHRLILQYNRYGKENLLVELGVEDLVSPGRLAPLLRLTNKHIRPINSLVVFYESGCGPCEAEMLQLRGNYPVLKEKGMEIISISADREEAVFNATAMPFPWTDKYCDFMGLAGENFRNYLVQGTPTIIVTDSNGTITGRYARISDYLDELRTKR